MGMAPSRNGKLSHHPRCRRQLHRHPFRQSPPLRPLDLPRLRRKRTFPRAHLWLPHRLRRSAMRRLQPPLLFEIAWEVCWQLGGIYTVLRTKAGAMLERWGDRYCLIGPYNPQTAPLEFEEQPTYGSIREAVTRLRESGLPCLFRALADPRPAAGDPDRLPRPLWQRSIRTNTCSGKTTASPRWPPTAK